MNDLPPELAGSTKFQVLSKLGEGGMGAVYKARHNFLNELVAIKVMNAVALSNPDARSRFLREMQAVGQLKHKNIVRALDAEEIGSLLVLVMEYVEGITLDRLVAQKGILPVAYSCQCIARAALGLQFAHEKGMVHRDIKPANLILATKEKEVKLLDFGLARGPRAEGDGQSDTGRLRPGHAGLHGAGAGHRRQQRRHPGGRLQPGLHAVLPPGGPIALPAGYGSHDDDGPGRGGSRPLSEVRPDVPAELWAVMAKMLAKKPDDRFQTPKDLELARSGRSSRGEPRRWAEVWDARQTWSMRRRCCRAMPASYSR